MVVKNEKSSPIQTFLHLYLMLYNVKLLSNLSLNNILVPLIRKLICSTYVPVCNSHVFKNEKVFSSNTEVFFLIL